MFHELNDYTSRDERRIKAKKKMQMYQVPAPTYKPRLGTTYGIISIYVLLVF
jgi:hypothetical protein